MNDRREYLRKGQKRMRLICPNCDAEYQVDDAAIPEAGRDVQCSNCGHAWFQVHADAEMAREAEEDVFGDAQSAADIPAAEQAAADVMAEPEPADPDAADTTAMPPSGTRQTLAESVLSVLREEAERETAVRREEGPAPRYADQTSNLETQTEFGLDDAAPSDSASAAARHIARLKGTDADLPALAEAKSAARRDLLPDIEEINSTLRATSDRAQAEMDEVDALPDLKPRRRGFRSGFVLTMIVAVAMAMAYIMAPRIIAQMPATAPTMRAYVAAVDSGRLWLDGMMKSASGSLRSFSGDGS
jgi:predicted Zn finger-like uncharacterized protein